MNSCWNLSGISKSMINFARLNSKSINKLSLQALLRKVQGKLQKVKILLPLQCLPPPPWRLSLSQGQVITLMKRWWKNWMTTYTNFISRNILVTQYMTPWWAKPVHRRQRGRAARVNLVRTPYAVRRTADNLLYPCNTLTVPLTFNAVPLSYTCYFRQRSPERCPETSPSASPAGVWSLPAREWGSWDKTWEAPWVSSFSFLVFRPKRDDCLHYLLLFIFLAETWKPKPTESLRLQGWNPFLSCRLSRTTWGWMGSISCTQWVIHCKNKFKFCLLSVSALPSTFHWFCFLFLQVEGHGDCMFESFYRAIGFQTDPDEDFFGIHQLRHMTVIQLAA